MVSSGIVTSLMKETQSQYETGVDVGGDKVAVGEAVTVGEGSATSIVGEGVAVVEAD